MQAAWLWHSLQAALDASGPDAVSLLQSRTDQDDWVRDGMRLPQSATRAAVGQLHRFLEAAPEYPAAAFAGRGVIILGGSLKYIVPAWVAIHMLRRTGCTLPVEIFFPEKEFPTPELEASLTGLGAVCRLLPGTHEQANPGETLLSGFAMKAIALIVSRFKEVLFLDADNIAVADPASLFGTEEYQRTGAILWPDYWESTVAPDLADILGVEAFPPGSFESGQMVFDKQRTWQALRLAAYLNIRASLYYELFTGYLGKGDKESFAFALHATGTPYALVPHAVGSVGTFGEDCEWRGDEQQCETVFQGNLMTQFAPDGSLMFLHANYPPKLSLEIPGDFAFHRRRWQVMMPGGKDFLQELGDLEQEVHAVLVAFRCSKFLPSYLQVMKKSERGGDAVRFKISLEGFPPVYPGINFKRAYRWGLSGTYLNFTEVTLRDRYEHFMNKPMQPGILASLRLGLQKIMGRLPGGQPEQQALDVEVLYSNR